MGFQELRYTSSVDNGAHWRRPLRIPLGGPALRFDAAIDACGETTAVVDVIGPKSFHLWEVRWNGEADRKTPLFTTLFGASAAGLLRTSTGLEIAFSGIPFESRGEEPMLSSREASCR
jgi:hypothetical protein